MICHDFWVREKHLIHVDGAPQELLLTVGSDLSREDASQKARALAQTIEARVRSRRPKTDDYEASIREHVEQRIDDHNVITVNRYGALVLNTTSLTILDIDYCPPSLLDRLTGRHIRDEKARIVATFKKRVPAFPQLGQDFRIYETCRGIRVLGKQYLDPRAHGNRRLFRRLHVDGLYALLTHRQNCYRARLTPKPHRVKIENPRITSPLDCQTPAYTQWRLRYENAARYCRTVRLLETLGDNFANSPIVALHDAMTASQGTGPLA